MTTDLTDSLDTLRNSAAVRIRALENAAALARSDAALARSDAALARSDAALARSDAALKGGGDSEEG